MNRLTHTRDFGNEEENKEDLLAIRNKLFFLENIEEELGIELITLFKALKNGIWENDKYCNKILYLKPEDFTIILKEKYIYYEWGWPGPDYFIYYFNDYGKTWALTKEELEND